MKAADVLKSKPQLISSSIIHARYLDYAIERVLILICNMSIPFLTNRSRSIQFHLILIAQPIYSIKTQLQNIIKNPE